MWGTSCPNPLVVGMWASTTTMEDSLVSLHTSRKRSHIDPAILLLGINTIWIKENIFIPGNKKNIPWEYIQMKYNQHLRFTSNPMFIKQHNSE